MPERENSTPLQILGWILASLLLGPSAVAIDTAGELQLTREALRSLEQQQLQRLRELEQLEEEITRSAQRSLALRARERALSQRMAEQGRAIAVLVQAVNDQELALAEGREVLRQLLRAQWLRQRHPLADPMDAVLTQTADSGVGSAMGTARNWTPEPADMPILLANHQRVFDQRVNRERALALQRQEHDLGLLQRAKVALAEAQSELSAAQAEITELLGKVTQQEAVHLDLVKRAQQRARADALELERLERNAATLAAVLRRMATVDAADGVAVVPEQPLQAAADAVQRAATPAQIFADARGRLAWPVPGPILSRYGSVRGSGVTSTWRGDVFAVADDATPVRVVHDGRVVFADWMRGYGFLVIVDHGQGYLTLYGNVRDILVASEQKVLQGDVIAHAGGASAVIAPGLYFELRHEGQTLNPAAWWDTK